MKRVIFAITGTVVGLVGLLSFKSHGVSLAPVANAPVPTGPVPSTPVPRTPAPRSVAPAANGTHAAPKRYAGPAVQTPYGVVQVAVVVSGGHIRAVRLPRLTAFDSTSQMINSQAAPILVRETMSAQSARIHAVSGATYTSEGYLQSLQAALDKAGR